jgi:phosphate transport system substrate-binding protein
MKKILISLSFAVLLIITNAQSVKKSVIKITGTKFPFEIMQQWIDVYSKTHPGVLFQLSKSIPADSADLVIAAHAFKPGELKDDQNIVAVNRYAQLPIINSNRPDRKDLQRSGFTQQDLKNIFFVNNETENYGMSNPFTVYKRNKNVCASRAFSEDVIGQQIEIYGVNVTGDDRALSAAVRNDVIGISYNNLGLVYNTKTRKVADSIAVIPIDINENGVIDSDEKNYSTLDSVLDFLYKTKSTKIPQENVNVVFNKNNPNKAAIDFLKWIITEGQQYNRIYGFLNLQKSVAGQEQAFLNTILKNNNNTVSVKNE